MPYGGETWTTEKRRQRRLREEQKESEDTLSQAKAPKCVDFPVSETESLGHGELPVHVNVAGGIGLDDDVLGPELQFLAKVDQHVPCDIFQPVRGNRGIEAGECTTSGGTGGVRQSREAYVP